MVCGSSDGIFLSQGSDPCNGISLCTILTEAKEISDILKKILRDSAFL